VIGASAALLPAGSTVAEARRRFAAALRENGFDTPELDARILIGHVLGLDHAGLASASAQVLDDDAAARLSRAAARRLRREPVALIIGHKEFWGLPLSVTSATLIPRPETETLVETALDFVRRTATAGRALRIADLGTGSGAILLALLSELPNAFGVGTDREIAALRVARDNAAALGLTARAGFVAADFAAPLVGGFDLVVSNPPYICSSEIEELAPGVRDFEPRSALDGGADGLDAYRAIAADCRRLLAPGGHIVVEIGLGQAAAVRGLFEEAGCQQIAIINDLAGIARSLAFAPAAREG